LITFGISGGEGTGRRSAEAPFRHLKLITAAHWLALQHGTDFSKNADPVLTRHANTPKYWDALPAKLYLRSKWCSWVDSNHRPPDPQ
jgi:hypothetical protein